MLYEQGAEQGGDVQAVGVGIGEDADFAVAQAGQVIRTGVYTKGDGDIVNLL